MFASVRAYWALLAGIGLLMLGHGLQNSLLGVRASLESFPTAVTGFVMAGYSLGFLFSAISTPRLVRRVGHVRVFAAMAALASSAILVHAIWIEPITWFLLRFISGMCMSGVYIVAESWLNASTTNENRGKLLSIYMVVQLLFWAGGPLLLNIADPLDYTLFIAVSIIVSVAVVPLLLSSVSAPAIPQTKPFSLIDLYRVSPLGCIGMVSVGISQGAFFSMGAVFGQDIGFTLPQISLMLSATSFAAMLSQWPIGWISDRYDRRTVLTITTFGTAITLMAAFLFGPNNPPAFVAIFALYGALAMPMYSLCIAHTNDYLDVDEMVGASGALAFAAGLGTMVGPLVIGPLMQFAGSMSFVASLAFCHAALGLFAIYRATRRSALPIEEQGQHVWVPSAATSPVTATIVQETAAELAHIDSEQQSAT